MTKDWPNRGKGVKGKVTVVNRDDELKYQKIKMRIAYPRKPDWEEKQ